jgi:phage I-like protein
VIRRHTLTVGALVGGEPPTEFCIFTAGAVETSKGTFIFDVAAAQAVMAAYVLQGNEMMIDYDHASLGSNADPALASRAAGWFNLEVRNGELWAVNVRWTPPAATALRVKEWRYMSPAFSTAPDGHITALMNVAITNLPATRNLQPLMAANVHALGASMDPDQVKAALDAIAAGDTEKCAEILKAMIAAAAGSGEPAAAEETTDPTAETSADPAPGTVETSESEDEEDKPAAVAASLAKLFRLSGKASIVATVAEVETWRTSHIELEEGRTANAKERAILESAERRKGCADLVVKAGRSPASVWSDSAGKSPKAYLLSMPITDFRAYVADQVKTNARRPGVKPPGGSGADDADAQEFSTSNGTVTLSASELAECKRAGAKPEVFAANKALRAKRSNPKGSV